ncbi:class D beta-lactamase [Bacillus aquiflavi]|uniref:Beta-lactamase n=1 Tax=Bacillus aquiflavi TaxID=2672567 RepID=A0A6B3VV31_9BACI|nr:class D beta-lactamase [Bacillus aquiflavi]MBA4536751.1 class D beta-lactamase [Bacillus aquiflavi]NEY81118.1 class D beta-lactamase [Bacillus aquiflavi]
MKQLKNLAVLLVLLGAVVLFISVDPPKESYAANNNLNMKKIKVDEFFTEYDGTFILRNIKNGRSFIFNIDRANQRFAPQSTFKIPNALIGLQVGAVEDEYDIKYWDGVVREIEVWNQDHTLGSGLRHSVVWYYQAMACDIGEERMEEWIHRISYGNRDISGGIDQFWLSSSLKISPIEQAKFMEALYKEKLPFDKSVMKTVKRIMIQKEGDNYTLYGKTGQGSDLGWYVGFIEAGNQAYSFVTNIVGTSADAKHITMDILKKYHLMTE